MTGALWTATWAVFAREFKLALRERAEWMQPLVFYVLVVLMFGLATAPGDPALRTFAPAIIWVGALLAALMGLERMFRADLEDGTLEQLLLAPVPLAPLVAAKILSRWCVSGAPLVVLGPVLAVALGLAGVPISVLVAGLLLGTPTLMLIGAFAAALTVAVPRAGVLLPVLVLPLMAPVVVFGAGAVRAAGQGLPAAAPLYFLAAELVLAAVLIPWAAAAALRNALE
ncbi:MAG: heme exporter protein CcmB [Nevskiaceae bacterium]|nr:MAG: heme exporter protein CcmB [Nevskiaceae bacterium]TBR73911.1 MAG: heme exporter protein CcmB [Nevskiaceae bacterium]